MQQKALFPCLDEIAGDLAENSYLYRNKQEIVKIPYRDILTFSSHLHYIDILTVSGSYCEYSSLGSILGRLPKEFIRTHRSYLVNMSHIYKIAGHTITLSNNMTVPISRSYANRVVRDFTEYAARFG